MCGEGSLAAKRASQWWMLDVACTRQPSCLCSARLPPPRPPTTAQCTSTPQVHQGRHPVGGPGGPRAGAGGCCALLTHSAVLLTHSAVLLCIFVYVWAWNAGLDTCALPCTRTLTDLFKSRANRMHPMQPPSLVGEGFVRIACQWIPPSPISPPQEEIDTVMHFAAQTHVDNSFGNSMAFTMNNTWVQCGSWGRGRGQQHGCRWHLRPVRLQACLMHRQVP